MSIPKTTQLIDIQDAFRDLERKIEPLRTGNVNLNGRRVINAGNAIGAFDYITKFDLDETVADILDQSSNQSNQVQGALINANKVRFGEFATRGSANSHDGEFFSATDHHYVTWLSIGSAWIVAFGTDSGNQSTIAATAALLGLDDAGFKFYVIDYAHLMVWTGSAWTFAPEDDGSNYYLLAATTPNRGVWHLCDGTTVSFLAPDGTLSFIGLDDLTTSSYLKVGITPNSTSDAASGTTDDESAHTHSFTTGAPSATVAVDNVGGGSTVAVGTGTHTHSGTTTAGSAHNHGPGTLELRRRQLILYFRQ